MKRRHKMCESCPFRGADDNYKRECAEMAADDWPCHSEGYFGMDSDVQCRGHYEAVRKFGDCERQMASKTEQEDA